MAALNRPNAGEPDGTAEVIVAQRDGLVELVTGDWVATEPSLSPNDRTLVVVRADGNYESSGPDATALWTMDIDGSNPEPLTRDHLDADPSWSPDGAVIAFARRDAPPGGEQQAIATIDIAGGQPTVLTHGAVDTSPAWSPDGRQIAFIRSPLGSTPALRSIWVMDADGADARPIGELPHAHRLDWHPDGTSILVSTHTGGDGSVSLVDLDTGDVRLLAEHAALARWTRDGARVLYLATRGGPQGTLSLTQGRIVQGRLDAEREITRINAFLYPGFGLSVGACA